MKLTKASLITLALLLACSRAAAGTLNLCNDGAVRVSVASAIENSFWFEPGHTWKVSGWMQIRPRDCAAIDTDSGHPIYLAFTFTDIVQRWGTADFDPNPGDDVFQRANTNLCVDRAQFSYTRGGSDPGGPCKEGYFPIRASTYFDPDEGGPYTLHFALNPQDLATPIIAPANASATSDSHMGARIAGAAVGLGVLIAGKILLDHIASDSAASGAPTDAPKPFAPGTLNATLFARRVVRRASGDGRWFFENGTPVNPIYGLDGQTMSDLLDPPQQRVATDPAVTSLAQALTRAFGTTPWRQRSQITDVGRFYYAFEDEKGLLHEAWVNLSTLDFARVQHLTGQGYTGLEIPCTGDRGCMVGDDRDSAGHPSNTHVYASINLYFGDDNNGRQAWSALQKLRNLYPGLPAVTAR